MDAKLSKFTKDGWSYRVRAKDNEIILDHAEYFFYNNSRLEHLGNVRTATATNFTRMFSGCNTLTVIPKVDTFNGTVFDYMFYGCSEIISAPELVTGYGRSFVGMFYGCSKLTTIPKLDLYNAINPTALDSIFAKCPCLENLYLHNIRTNLSLSASDVITVNSLVHTVKELCKVPETRTLTIGSINLSKIAHLYCRVINDSNEKITMELCDSSCEGAITLIEYAALKNWVIS